MNQALSRLLCNYFCNSFASIKMITQIIEGLFEVRDVNLASIALAIEGEKQDSRYKKLQRFFKNFKISHEALAHLLVKIAGIADEKWLLALDRTNWKFGKKDINILVLSICYKGIAIPIMWDLLDKAGSSNSIERKELLERFLSIFDVSKIAGLLGDREFIGDKWLQYLVDRSIPFYIRIKESLTIGRSEGEIVTANHLVKKLEKGEYTVLKGKRSLGKNYLGPKLSVSALRTEEGELVIVATNDRPHAALNIYRERWQIETLFGCLKTRGFNFENTHMVHLDRISTLLAMLSIAFTFAYIVGLWLHEVKPIKFKSHGRKAVSFFRYGLDYLRRIFLKPEKMAEQLKEIIERFIEPFDDLLQRLTAC
jgi:hypothetical protein